MKQALLLFILITPKAFALEAVITVLEAPLFKEKSHEAQVVQYLRKGDTIKVHPSLARMTDHDHLAPAKSKYDEIKKRLDNSPEWQDPLFNGQDENVPSLQDEFIPVLDRQGNVVYVLSEHIYVYFNDARELTQTIPLKDPTDYRLDEPLPAAYPLTSPSGYRGQLLLGFSQPYNESYPYRDPVKTKGYQSPVEFNAALLWNVSYDKQDRFFFGALFHLKTFSNQYSFFDLRTSDERYLIFGAGPLISYDAYKGHENRLNVSGSISLNPFNYLTIRQSSPVTSDSRAYNSFNFTPKVSIQYHRKNIVEELDFVLGTSLIMETPATYRARDGGAVTGFWNNLGADKFRTRMTFNLSGHLGLQAAY